MKRMFMLLMLFILVLAIFTGCSGRKFIMSEGEINKIPEITKTEAKEYSVLWANFHPVLLMSEGIGARHDLHLEDKRIFSGIKVIDNHQMVKLMVIVANPQSVDFSKAKAIISSRSGKHFYSVDGKDMFSKNGYLAPKFEWSKIEILTKTGIEIENINFGSERDKKIQEILVEIGKKLDGQKIPGILNRILSRVAKITTQDIFLAGATDFSSLFAIFGVRVWAIIDAVIQKADLSLPYYDTAMVDRFQLGLALKPIQEKINNLESGKEIIPLIQQWEKEMLEYKERKKRYDINEQNWLKEKAKYEQ